jgi:glycosyltransferase involved in cell wall biosynthesis
MKLLYSTLTIAGSSNGPGVNELTFVESLLKSDQIDVRVLVPVQSKKYIQNDNRVLFFPCLNSKFFLFFNQFIQFSYLLYLTYLFRPRAYVFRVGFFPVFLAMLSIFIQKPIFIKTAAPPTNNWLLAQKGIKGYLSSIVMPLHSFLVTAIYRRSSVIDACTEQIVGKIKPLLIGCKATLIHIENSVDIDKFQPNRRNLRDGITIGFAGGLPLERGAMEILQVVRRLRLNGLNVDGFIVGGSANDASKLKLISKEYNISNYIKICGKVPFSKIPELMRYINIGVAFDLPDRVQDIGNSNQKIRQYLACGLPVITSINSAPDLCDNLIVHCVDPKNTDSIASIITDYQNKNSSEKQLLQNNAREIAVSSYSSSHLLNKRVVEWKKIFNS